MPIKDCVRVYSGTTIENFKICAYRMSGGQIYFDKSKEPKHTMKRIYYTPSIASATDYAQKVAAELHHSPAVISGEVPVGYLSDDFYSIRTEMPVDEVWVPKIINGWSIEELAQADVSIDDPDEIVMSCSIKSNPEDFLMQN